MAGALCGERGEGRWGEGRGERGGGERGEGRWERGGEGPYVATSVKENPAQAISHSLEYSKHSGNAQQCDRARRHAECCAKGPG
jgi:hypothetical protein